MVAIKLVWKRTASIVNNDSETHYKSTKLTDPHTHYKITSSALGTLLKYLHIKILQYQSQSD